MSATVWFIIAIVGFSFAGILLITAVFMFIKMNIPAVIGDLTGKTVAREIKAMRDANVLSGDKRFRPSKVNLERGTLTDKVGYVQPDANAQKQVHASKRLDKAMGEIGGVFLDGTITESLSDNATEILSDNATEILNENMTDALSDNAAASPSGTLTEVTHENATEVLTEVTVGTTVLDQTEKLEENIVDPIPFVVVKSELVVHTDEVIG